MLSTGLLASAPLSVPLCPSCFKLLCLWLTASRVLLRLFREQVRQYPVGCAHQRIQMGALVIVRGVDPRADQRDRHIPAGPPERLPVRCIVGIVVRLERDGVALCQLAQLVAE